MSRRIRRKNDAGAGSVGSQDGDDPGLWGHPEHRLPAMLPAQTALNHGLELHHPVAEAIANVHLVDHHVHAPLQVDYTPEQIEAHLTESDRPAPTGVPVFDSQLGFAIRRHCAPLLGLEPGASREEYFEARGQHSAQELADLFLARTGVSDWVVDTGHGGPEIWDATTMSQRAPGATHEILRLESTLESIAAHTPADQFVSRFEETIHARMEQAKDSGPGIVGFKTIAAYRGGFDFEHTRPSQAEVTKAAERWKREAEETGTWRLSDPTLIRMVLHVAAQTGLPLQIHVGFGDPDADLAHGNPLLLRKFIEEIEPTGARIMLLHTYPFHREAGYLAHVYPHVYTDVGLAINYTGAASMDVIRESMELTPFGKLMYSSDAWGPPELHYLGSVLWRAGTARVLGSWVDTGEWTQSDAARVIRMVGAENATRVYGLGE